jgi:putative ABC transport system permease protein
VWHDLKLALRMIRSRPGFALVVLVTLALGIGANTAIFSVVDAVVLRPLPYRDPQRLYFIFPTNARDGGKDRLARLAEVQVLERQLRSFGALASHTMVWEMLATSEAGESVPIQASFVSANLLDVLGVAPALGRAFLPEEDVVGGPRVAIISHALWQRRFGGDPAILDRTLRVGGGAARIVGVLPAGVGFPDSTCELWLPRAQSAGALRWRLLGVVGRLNAGASEQQARAELGPAARRLEEEFPDTNVGVGLRLAGVHQELTSQTRPTLLLLLGAVGLVLLIACANVANLMLARGLSRSGELAVRAALGASRGRLLRQLVTEGLLLALAGGAAGVVVAGWGVTVALQRSPIRLPGSPAEILDLKVLAFAIVISLLTGVGASLIPAWRLVRADPQPVLREQGRGATSAPGQRRLSGLLVVAQVALAVILLIGAGLLIRTVTSLLAVDPGFASRNLLTLQVRRPGLGAEPAKQSATDRAAEEQRLIALRRQVDEQLVQLPGVTAIGHISRLPFGPLPNVLQSLEVQDRPLAPGQRPMIDVRYATTDYFRAMGIPLHRGRVFTEQDTNLVTINQTAARRFWPGEDPIGKQVRTQGSNDAPIAWHTVVGIVGDVRHLALDVQPRPELYYFAPPEQRSHLVVRTVPDPASMIPAVREAILRVDRRFAIIHAEPMEALMGHSMSTRRFGMVLVASFAALALLLAAIGLFGVLSYAVAQRRREIGVRMALGAQGRDVSWMVVREGMSLVLVGTAVGLAGALALGRVIARLLYGVSAVDPLTLAAVSLLLGLVALVACGLAARRATRIDPMMVLREG